MNFVFLLCCFLEQHAMKMEHTRITKPNYLGTPVHKTTRRYTGNTIQFIYKRKSAGHTLPPSLLSLLPSPSITRGGRCLHRPAAKRIRVPHASLTLVYCGHARHPLSPTSNLTHFPLSLLLAAHRSSSSGETLLPVITYYPRGVACLFSEQEDQERRSLNGQIEPHTTSFRNIVVRSRILCYF